MPSENILEVVGSLVDEIIVKIIDAQIPELQGINEGDVGG